MLFSYVFFQIFNASIVMLIVFQKKPQEFVAEKVCIFGIAETAF
jgi:hypothetical protein